MVSITATGTVEEILTQMGGLTSNEIALLTGLAKDRVWSGLKRLRQQGIVTGELIICDKKTRGSPPYLWSIKKQ